MANLHETIACHTLEDEPSSNICVHCFLLLLNIPANSYSQVCTASYFVEILPDIEINDVLSPSTNCIIKGIGLQRISFISEESGWRD